MKPQDDINNHHNKNISGHLCGCRVSLSHDFKFRWNVRDPSIRQPSLGPYWTLVSVDTSKHNPSSSWQAKSGGGGRWLYFISEKPRAQEWQKLKWCCWMALTPLRSLSPCVLVLLSLIMVMFVLEAWGGEARMISWVWSAEFSVPPQRWEVEDKPHSNWQPW